MNPEKRLYAVTTHIKVENTHFVIAETSDEAKRTAEEIVLDIIRTEGVDEIDSHLESWILGSIRRETVFDMIEASQEVK